MFSSHTNKFQHPQENRYGRKLTPENLDSGSYPQLVSVNSSSSMTKIPSGGDSLRV